MPIISSTLQGHDVVRNDVMQSKMICVLALSFPRCEREGERYRVSETRRFAQCGDAR